MTQDQPAVGNVIHQAKARRIALPVAALFGWAYDSPRRVRLRRAHARESVDHLPSQQAVDRERIEDGAARLHLSLVWLAVILASLLYPIAALCITPWLLVISARRRASRRAPLTMRQAVRTWKPAVVPMVVAGVLTMVWHQLPTLYDLAWSDPSLSTSFFRPALGSALTAAGIVLTVAIAVYLGNGCARDHEREVEELDDVRQLLAAAVGSPDHLSIEITRTPRGLTADLTPIRTSMTTMLTAELIDSRLSIAASEWTVEAVSGLTVTLREAGDDDLARRSTQQQTSGLLGGESLDEPDADLDEWNGWSAA